MKIDITAYRKKILLCTALLSVTLLMACQSKKTDYVQQADVYLRSGDYSLALESYSKAIMEDERLQEAYRGAGIADLYLSDYEAAEDMFLRALRESDGTIKKTEIDLSYYLGETQVCLGKYEDAIECYTNIIDYDDKQTAAYFYRGSAYLQTGEKKKAAADFEKIENVGDMAYLYGIYEAYAAAGSDEGEAYLQKIISQKAKSAEEFYFLGKAYAQLKEYEKAITALKESEQKGQKEAAFYMGYVSAQQGDYDSAISYYQAYKENAGLTYEQYRTIADYMMEMGDYTSALELNEYMCERAADILLQNLLFDKIVIYEKSGNFSEARNRAETYTQQYPEDMEGLREYEFLLTR